MNDLMSIGLVFNFIGAILLAFSFRAISGEGTHTPNEGKTNPFVLVGFDKWRFRIGIWVIAFGFFLQMITVFFRF